jgi:putative protease
VLNYYGNHGVAELRIDTGEDLSVGEEVLFLGPTTGVVQQFVKELRKDLVPVDTVEQTELFSMQTESLVRRGDKLYKLVDTEELKKKKREQSS